MQPLLLRFLQTSPGEGARLFAELTQVERTGLVRAARGHGLSGVVLSAIEADAAAIQSEDLQFLRRDARALAAGTLRTRMLLFRALDSLSDAGVRATPLKGYALGSRLYQEPLRRPASDVDLLILPEELPLAEAALTRMGLQTREEHAAAYEREFHHHLSYSGKAGLVELHFRAMTGFGTEIPAQALLEHSREGELEGHPIRLLEPSRELLFLAVHAAKHLLSRLSWLYDLKLYVERMPVDWSVLVSMSRETGTDVAAFLALNAAQASLGAAIPRDVLEQLRPSWWQGRVIDLLFTEERLVSAELGRSKVALLGVPALLSSSFSRSIRFSAHHGLRVLRRRVAFRFPAIAPPSWRG